MARVRIIHWRARESGPLIEACRGCGFEVEYEDLKFPDLAKSIRRNPPDVLVIDLDCLPGRGRDTAIAFRRAKWARHIPIVFVGGAPEKVDAIRGVLPDALFTPAGQLCSRIRSARAKQPADPVVPPGPMASYGDRTAAQKLGIKAGAGVALVDAPRGYAAVLGTLPEGVQLIEAELEQIERVEYPNPAHAVTLWFVRDPRAYQAALRRMRGVAERAKLWVVWRKNSTEGLTQYTIREAANEAGLVDYKICAVTDVWSAMAFARRKS